MNIDITDKQNLGVVMMLDLSGSMFSVMPMIKIDSKAFVRCSRAGDQFGVNAFSDKARWVYPSGCDPDIATVTAGLRETEEAVQLIENLQAHGRTNIGDAIRLGNQMIKKSSAATKAFVLLSDGWSNCGLDPVLVLEDEPPLYIAGLGLLETPCFKSLIAKNKKSRFYSAPNAYEMMQIFNYIVSDSSDTNLTVNSLKQYSAGSDYILESFDVSEEDNDAQLSVVWSDKKYKYTRQTPYGDSINVTLIEPSGKQSSAVPEIVDDGYCIFNLHNVQPKQWKLLIQYSTKEALSGTVGGFEFHTSIKTDLTLPTYIKKGESFHVAVAARSDKGLDKLTVKAEMTRPDFCVDKVLERFAGELRHFELENEAENDRCACLKKLRARKLKDENIDILPLKHITTAAASFDKDEGHTLTVDDTDNSGAYNIKVEICGVDQATQRPFRSLKAGTVIVE